ncbi:acyltransferase family protein [Bacteroides fragilis]|nr:acyltransferase family protein [Bacteroides fragilis]
MQEKKELNWINVAKAISIITVLFVHTENYYGLELGEINQFLCGFYVNAFFLISGYLLFRKHLINLPLKRVRFNI